MTKLNVIAAAVLSLTSVSVFSETCAEYNSTSSYKVQDQVFSNGSAYQAVRDVPQWSTPSDSWFWAPIDACSSDGGDVNVVDRPQRFLQEVRAQEIVMGGSLTEFARLQPASLRVEHSAEGGYSRTLTTAGNLLVESGSTAGGSKTDIDAGSIELGSGGRGAQGNYKTTTVKAGEISTPSLLINGVNQGANNSDQAAQIAALLQRIEVLEAR